MAGTSATHAVLFNSDLLHIILLHSSRDDIASIRLCNTTLEATASPHLFRRLLISSRKRFIRRLQRVSNTPKFAKGVREIVWETAHYGRYPKQDQTVDFPAVLYSSGCDLKPDDALKQHRAFLARFERLQLDEEELLKYNSIFPILSKTLGRFTGLTSVTVTIWDQGESGERTFFDGGALVPGGRTMPPPYRTLMCPRFAHNRQCVSFAVLLGSFVAVGLSIKHLTIKPTPDRALRGIRETSSEAFPPMLIPFDILTEAMHVNLTRSLLNLTKLHLAFGDKCDSIGTICLYETVRYGGLTRFLARLTKLKDIQILMRASCIAPATPEKLIIPLAKIFGDITFFDLQRLKLDSFWLESNELCSFLSRHASTLKELTLSNVNLGGTADAFALVLRNPGSTFPLLQGYRV